MSTNTYDFDLAMQRKILALLAQDFNFLETVGVEVIRPNYFDSMILSNVCKWILRYNNEYHNQVTESVLLTELNRYEERVNVSNEEHELYESAIKELFTVVLQDAPYLKDKVIEFARRCSFREAILNAKDIYDADGDYESVMQTFQKALTVGAGSDLGTSFLETLDNFPDTLNEFYDKKHIFKTNIPSLDDAMMGGMGAGELHTIAGGPGRGKSKFMAYLALQGLKQNRKVAYITLELKEKDVMANILSCFTGMTLMDLMNPDNREEYKRKVDRIKVLNPQLRIKYYSNKSVNTNHLRTYFTKLKALEGFDPDLIIVDYADLMNPTYSPRVREDNTYEVAGNIYYDLVELADLYKCPVVTGCQITRDSWNNDGENLTSNLEHIAESARKAHVAYSVITLSETKAEKLCHKIRLYTAKMRRGKSDETIYCNFDKATSMLTECHPYDPKNPNLEMKDG